MAFLFSKKAWGGHKKRGPPYSPMEDDPIPVTMKNTLAFHVKAGDLEVML
jgi:hypothetical protein